MQQGFIKAGLVLVYHDHKILLANSVRGVLRGEKYNRREKQEKKNVPKPAEKHGNT
jgi:hypothetical protein